MSKSRNLADLLDGNGDVKASGLDNVPPSNDASALTTGTLSADRLGAGSIAAAKLADTYITNDGFNNDRSGSTFSTALTDTGQQITNTSSGAVYDKRVVLNDSRRQHLMTSFTQNTSSRWFKVMTPQVYSDGAGGGSAKFTASYQTAHAAGSALKEWHMAFGNSHGKDFYHAFRYVTDLKATDSYYGWNPQIYLYKNSSTGDTQMREMYVEFRDHPSGVGYIKVFFEIEGYYGGNNLHYTITDLGSSTPSGISLIQSMT